MPMNTVDRLLTWRVERTTDYRPSQWQCIWRKAKFVCGNLHQHRARALAHSDVPRGRTRCRRMQTHVATERKRSRILAESDAAPRSFDGAPVNRSCRLCELTSIRHHRVSSDESFSFAVGFASDLDRGESQCVSPSFNCDRRPHLWCAKTSERSTSCVCGENLVPAMLRGGA